jgi:CTD kinase subunit beta
MPEDDGRQSGAIGHHPTSGSAVDRQRKEGVEIVGLLTIDRGRRVDLARPVRTFDTAVIYYHKFRLVHSDTEYSYTVRMADYPR